MATFEINPEAGVGAALIVSGPCDPDAAGYYYELGVWNDWRYYARHDDAYHLWSRNDNQHFLTTVLDEVGPGFWFNPAAGPLGQYAFGAPYSGTPTIKRQPTVSPLGPGTTVLRRNRNHWRGRSTGKRKALPDQRMIKIENTFMSAARLWRALSPAMKLIWVGDGNRPLTARNRKRSLARGMRRWMQVQMPLLLAGLPPEASTKQRFTYKVRNLQVTQLDLEGERALLWWQWERDSESEERVVLHVSQLRPRLIDRDNVWKYARLCFTKDYPVGLSDPGWQNMFEWVPLTYPANSGDTIQLYSRFELMDNRNPPVSVIGSLMTCEDWDPLRYTMP